jgi:hypothetical protein
MNPFPIKLRHFLNKGKASTLVPLDTIVEAIAVGILLLLHLLSRS